MKRIYYIVIALLMMLGLAACENVTNSKQKSRGKRFNPTERTSRFTDEEREKKIAEKRAALDSIQLDMETLVFENNIKLTVLPPIAQGDINANASQVIAVKMMQIVAQNGVGGYGNSPAFCLATAITPTGRLTTGTVPQRMLTKYTITFAVGNMLTSEIYATYDMDVEGVGASFEEAAYNAVNNIHNEKGIQQMLKTATQRILAWYNDDPQRFKSTVESYVAKQDYSTAYALLSTVPKEAAVCYKYAASRQGQVLEEMKTQKAEELLTDLRNRIASAGDQYDPMIAGCLQLIPARSKQYAEAKKLYDNYTKHVQDVRMNAIKHEQEIQKSAIKHEQQMELERLAMEKMKLKYEQEAAMRAAQEAFTPPTNKGKEKTQSIGIESSSDNRVAQSSGSSSSSGGGIVKSFKEHPFLWGLGLGAVAIATGGTALYAGLPFTTKLGLALL